jgi:hypothetical protein
MAIVDNLKIVFMLRRFFGREKFPGPKERLGGHVPVNLCQGRRWGLELRNGEEGGEVFGIEVFILLLKVNR